MCYARRPMRLVSNSIDHACLHNNTNARALPARGPGDGQKPETEGNEIGWLVSSEQMSCAALPYPSNSCLRRVLARKRECTHCPDLAERACYG